MIKRLDNKAILVTGAAGAIGRATAMRLASEGARLILSDRPSQALDAVATDIAATGGHAEAVTFDAESGESCTALVDKAASRLGALDAICNIAGIYAKTRFTDISAQDWTRMMQINLSSVFAISQRAIPHLAASGGVVVNTSSLAALEGLAYSASYAVSKAGVLALTKSLAAEYASAGIRFNAICPGGIRSSMSSATPVPDADPDLAFRRSKLRGFDGLGEPRDIAAAFAYLVSEDARFVSGTVLVVDGAQFLI
ncbi:MAG: SDR family NAD(P)-dependent oxidoreductase [Pseudomonadota bacterium]